MTEQEVEAALFFVLSSLYQDCTPEEAEAVVEAARAEVER